MFVLIRACALKYQYILFKSDFCEGKPQKFPRWKLQEDEVAAEFLYRCSEEALGVQSMVTSLLAEAISRIEQKHKCKAQLAQVISITTSWWGKMI